MKKQLVIKRLEQILLERKTSKAEMSRVANISQQAVNGWFKKGVISKDSARALAQHYGYEMEWILGFDNTATNINTSINNSTLTGSNISVSSGEQTILNNPQQDLFATNKEATGNKHRIDFLDVNAAAGVGIENPEYPEVISSLFLSDEGMRVLVGRKSADGVRLINVPTDSMAPTIPKGCPVLIDIKTNYFAGDGVYALTIGNRLLIKRLQQLVTGGYRLLSDNKLYPPEEITENVFEEVRIVGRFLKALKIDVIDL